MPRALAIAAVVFMGLCATGPAIAATGTLDTGALTPQSESSRSMAEIANTGAAATEGSRSQQAGPNAQPAKPTEPAAPPFNAAKPAH